MSRIINVKVHPKSRQEKVEQVSTNSYEAWTPAPADKGAANDAVRRLIAKHLGLAPSAIALKSGAASRTKLFVID
jgi:uncharacterized protein